MIDVEVIDDPLTAVVALDPLRSRLLAELSVPASAATLAQRVGITRQKVNYHLRTLEAHGLVKGDSERQWGGLTERLMVATAASYVVSPEALGSVAGSPARGRDRLSATYLISLAARMLSELSRLLKLSQQTGKRLATLSIDTEVRFRSPSDRAAFADDLTRSITELIARYHDESSSNGRPHRLVVVAHPLISEESAEVQHGEEE